eukprot:CAMPEP_0197437314 /NCGR_PEP_ID=MMETSP1175-20131217/4584_1 /TAXON_ID=1003142 /ORGANISM="Triceratium dubium, Strain CCMP147" /LENGTH=202 /DNA_ID=CAMNT_0042966805 /DNA_START=152 /DNA_END=758 /DNA_ORIENTATION=+
MKVEAKASSSESPSCSDFSRELAILSTSPAAFRCRAPHRCRRRHRLQFLDKKNEVLFPATVNIVVLRLPFFFSLATTHSSSYSSLSQDQQAVRGEPPSGDPSPGPSPPLWPLPEKSSSHFFSSLSVAAPPLIFAATAAIALTRPVLLPASSPPPVLVTAPLPSHPRWLCRDCVLYTIDQTGPTVETSSSSSSGPRRLSIRLP